MLSLDKRQVHKITEDVQQAHISLAHLSDDLVDHICCEVEQLMEEGKSFKEAYQQVKYQTGISVLKKIEEDTKFLIDKYYRLMKATMKITGNISLAIILIGTVFKILHWPGSAYLLAFGFLVVCAVFFPLAVYVNYKDTKKKKNLILHLSVLTSGILYMLGVVFKIEHWPGGGSLLSLGYMSFVLLVIPILLYSRFKRADQKKDKRILLLGALSLVIFILSGLFKILHWPGVSLLMPIGGILLISAFLPLYAWRRIQLEGKITGQFIYIIILTMFFILFNSLLALNVSEDYLRIFVDQTKNEKAISSYLEQKNVNLLQEIKPSTYSQESISTASHIKQEADVLCNYIEELQLSLLNRTMAHDSLKSSILMKHPEMISEKGNTSIAKQQLIGINGDGKARELKEKLRQFKTVLTSQFDPSSELIILSNKLLNLSGQVRWNKKMTWEEYHFENNPLINVLSTLNEFQTSIRLLESRAIHNLSRRNNQ
jgi:hypothetical protein